MATLEEVAGNWAELLLVRQAARLEDILLKGNVEKMPPQYATAALIYHRLTVEERDGFLLFMKVVAVDTAAQVLNELGGASSDVAPGVDFQVTLEGRDVTCDLVEEFLSQVEERGF